MPLQDSEVIGDTVQDVVARTDGLVRVRLDLHLLVRLHEEGAAQCAAQEARLKECTSKHCLEQG